MDLLCQYEHLECPNYDNGSRPVVEIKRIARTDLFEENAIYGKIIFMLKGELTYSYGVFSGYSLGEKKMLFLPPGYDFTLRAKDEAEILIIRLSVEIRFCECYLIETLRGQTSGLLEETYEPFPLKISEDIDAYVTGLLMYINKGLRCRYYFENKVKELFYLLKNFQQKKDLALFFREILSLDACFSQTVMHNSHKYKTLSEMAAAMGMSVTNIEKQFRKIYHMPGYKWMNRQKAKNIHHALCTENTPLKELAARFGFSSKSTFGEFCKKNLGEPPGQIREKLRPVNIEIQNSQNE